MAASYLPDTIQLINELTGKRFPASCVLCCADVAALYPNMAITDLACSMAAEAAIDAVCASGSLQPSQVSIEPRHLSHTLSTVLHNHYVLGPDGRCYRQISGTAMGSSCAPSYCNTVLATLEQPLVRDCMARGVLLHYRRFIDDLFAVASSAAEVRSQFFARFTGMDSALYSAAGQSRLRLDEGSICTGESVTFMDVTISKDPATYDPTTGTIQLRFNTYQKPMHAYLYLPFFSFHPASVKTSWLRGELVRYARTNSAVGDFAQLARLFWDRVLQRQYPLRLVRRAFAAVSFADRQTYLAVNRKPLPKGDPLASLLAPAPAPAAAPAATLSWPAACGAAGAAAAPGAARPRTLPPPPLLPRPSPASLASAASSSSAPAPARAPPSGWQVRAPPPGLYLLWLPRRHAHRQPPPSRRRIGTASCCSVPPPPGPSSLP